MTPVLKASPLLLALLVSALPTRLANQTPSPSRAGTLILKNTRSDAVQVEVRLGVSTNCQAHHGANTRTLRRNQRWVIVSPSVVCWRREQDPRDATRGWTPWEQLRVPAGTTREVNL